VNSPIPPAGDDKLHTTEKLARALEAEHDPRLAPLIDRARTGYYHDYLSPLPGPEVQLVADLTALGHTALAERVRDGEFDASRAEADAWLSTADEASRQMVNDLIDKAKPAAAGAAPSGAAFWKAQQRPQPTPPGQATPDTDEGNSVWVLSDVAANGEYVLTVHFNDDIAFPLNGSADRLDYAGALLTACGAAEHDAAVFKQLKAMMDIPEPEAMHYVIDLRKRRAGTSWKAGPFTLTPGVNRRGKPFVACEINGTTWQWSTGQAREHARQVLEVGSIVDHDANYRDFLIEAFELDRELAMQAVHLLQQHR
jgi:hypothetical protein